MRNAKDWNEVLAKLHIRQGAIRPISNLDITRFESSTGFLLPKSYCGYCTTVGPGDLVRPWNYRITVPYAKSEFYDLQSFNTEMRGFDISSLNNPAQMERAWLFASDVGNGLYFWDPAERTIASENEYATYIMYEDYKIDRLADTFWDFINQVCLTSCPPAYRKGEIELTFIPNE